MWIILEPVIFALIGTEIQINKIDPSTIGFGTVVLVGALLIRFVVQDSSAALNYHKDTTQSKENAPDKENFVTFAIIAFPVHAVTTHQKAFSLTYK